MLRWSFLHIKNLLVNRYFTFNNIFSPYLLRTLIFLFYCYSTFVDDHTSAHPDLRADESSWNFDVGALTVNPRRSVPSLMYISTIRIAAGSYLSNKILLALKHKVIVIYFVSSYLPSVNSNLKGLEKIGREFLHTHAESTVKENQMREPL